MKYYYEVLWYEGETEEQALQNDFTYEEFNTRKEAMFYYNKHKNDKNCWGWLVTKRNEYGEIVEDIIF